MFYTPLKNTCLYPCLLIFAGFANAQITVTGKVIDNINEPIEFANVVLVDAIKNEIVAGIITDKNGNFSVKTDNKGEFKLQISFVGFSDFLKQIDYSVDLNTIVLYPKNNLDEISVFATRQFIKRQGDKLIMNVSSNKLFKGRNILDVLKHAPYLYVDSNSGSVSMKGKARTNTANTSKRKCRFQQ